MNVGLGDFAAAKLDDRGIELWRWQVTRLLYLLKAYDLR